jgi:hypothetical protein
MYYRATNRPSLAIIAYQLWLIYLATLVCQSQSAPTSCQNFGLEVDQGGKASVGCWWQRVRVGEWALHYSVLID